MTTSAELITRTNTKGDDASKMLSNVSSKKNYKTGVTDQMTIPVTSNSIEELPEVKKTLPDKFYFKKLKKEKHVKFDKYLMLLEERNDYMTASEDNSFQLTPIPNFIAFLVLAIRAQFEAELQKGICFLEAKYLPTNVEVISLAESVYLNCDLYSDTLEVVANQECILMFLALLELLQRMEERIIQASVEVMDYVRHNSIFKYLRPHDFVIIDQINNFTMKCFVAQGRSTKVVTKNDPTINLIDKIMTEYYFDKQKERLEEVVQRNRFHELFYTDLRSIKSTTCRYLCRFILRNCIYLIRRYVGVTSSVLRERRHDSPKENNTTSVPYITGFAIYRMAQFLAVSNTEIKDDKDDIEDRIHFLMNVFSIHMDNLWFRQNKISNVVVSTEIERCHDDCPCGYH